MADAGACKEATRDIKPRNCADVEIVSRAIRMAIAFESGVFNRNFHGLEVSGEDSVFVIGERALRDRNRTVFHADAGAIAIAYASATEFEILDTDALALDDHDALALGVSAVCEQARALADSADRQVALRPRGDIAEVVARLDLDRVTIPSCAGSRREREAWVIVRNPEHPSRSLWKKVFVTARSGAPRDGVRGPARQRKA